MIQKVGILPTVQLQSGMVNLLPKSKYISQISTIEHHYSAFGSIVVTMDGGHMNNTVLLFYIAWFLVQIFVLLVALPTSTCHFHPLHHMISQ